VVYAALEGRGTILACHRPCGIPFGSCAPPGRIGGYRPSRWFHHRLMSAVPPGQTLPRCRRSKTCTRDKSFQSVTCDGPDGVCSESVQAAVPRRAEFRDSLARAAESESDNHWPPKVLQSRSAGRSDLGTWALGPRPLTAAISLRACFPW